MSVLVKINVHIIFESLTKGYKNKKSPPKYFGKDV
jgi:hypothetical protein